jgi:Uma2 family endonuclease
VGSITYICKKTAEFMGDALEKTNYSIAEYLAIEQETGEKHEYYFGEIFAVAGGTPLHGLLSANVVGTLRDVLKGKSNCRTYSSDVKIAMSKKRFSYPDAVVICGKTEMSEELSQAVTNPKLIVEVLSPSTSSYDREGKFRAYQKLDSFQEYVLISQETVAVDVFFREPQSNFWLYRSYTLLEDVIHLKSIDVEVSVSDLYLNWEEE